jgi:PKD repeat protein
MRKLGLIALLVTLTALLAVGCGDDEPKPSVSRLFASETCGVAPLRVDFRADAAGGTPMGDPTGTNNWLSMSWDFGDGTVIDDGASVAYHEYQDPGIYDVTVTVEDDEGERASRTRTVVVQADSLTIDAYALLNDEPFETVFACEPVELGITAETCGFDPVADSYERFVFHWEAGDSVYTSPTPRHSFSSEELGTQQVAVTVEDPTRSVTRRDTVTVEVAPSPGVELSLATDWQNNPGQPSEGPVLDRVTEEFPDYMTYSVRVVNDGPADAYNLQVTGDLPIYNRLLFDSAAPDTGTVTYDQGDKQWTWQVPQVLAGEEAVLDVTFYVEIASVGASYDFPSVMAPFPCDPTDDDLEATATLNFAETP